MECLGSYSKYLLCVRFLSRETARNMILMDIEQIKLGPGLLAVTCWHQKYTKTAAFIIFSCGYVFIGANHLRNHTLFKLA